uniref:Uncharacterized protein n=1 Tax=Peronospora matthiolae TaxID=2874970 RepID=A0AAV1VF01_9STRA
MSMQEQQKPPLFHDIPKSALFSRLEAFLPVMAEENKKLSEKVAAGEGAEHNIEVEEADEASDVDTDDGVAEDDAKEEKKENGEAPVIEMNFALGMMDEHDSDSEDTDAVGSKAAVEDEIVACTTGLASVTARQESETSFQMQHEKPSTKPRPVIQELN